MSDDYSLPLNAIVLHATCELADAFVYFQELKKNRDKTIDLPDGFPEKWSMSILLTPKVNTDFNGGIGWTGTSKGPGTTPNYFNSWVVGASPGAGVDIKAYKNGTVTYYISGEALLHPKQPLECEAAKNIPHALAQDFGIRDWLKRLLESRNVNLLHQAVEVDKPTFGAEIDIRANASGSYTYNFPLGTIFGSLGGSYETDQILSISFTPPVKDSPAINQFPIAVAGVGGGRERKRYRRNFIGQSTREEIAPRVDAPAATAVAPQRVPEAAKQRLDTIQLENTLRNLQINH